MLIASSILLLLLQYNSLLSIFMHHNLTGSIFFFIISEKIYSQSEKQRYDGWYNNLAHPEWGSINSHLLRKAPAAYNDSVYMIGTYMKGGAKRPSARRLSRLFMRGTDGMASSENRTALLAFFGQVVTNEIVMASESGCPIEMARIEIEKCDEMYDKECRGERYIPFHRAAYDRNTGQSPNAPREQINQMTAWIDGSFIYSTSEAWLNTMRSFENGSLLMEREGLMPVKNTMRVPLFNNPVPHVMRMLSPERLFLLGDPRTNQNPALLTFAIVLHRWHNVIANRVKNQHSDWTDEEIFQKARRIVVATLQNIVVYEYLPAFLGAELPAYTGYQPETHPGVSHLFQAAAFRYGHSLIPPGIYRRDKNCNFIKTPMGDPALRLCQMWWDSDDVFRHTTIEELLRGMASQISEKEDAVLCSDVRDKLFGPMEFTRRDLGALNIMRGRDNGLPDYNTARRAFHLPPKKSFEEINPELFETHPELLKNLISAYEGNLDEIDVYIGGMLESKGGRPGELFTAIILDQFNRIRNADRFWFENEENENFNKKEIEDLKKVTFWDIIVNSTLVGPDEIQRNVFKFTEGDPCPQPLQLNASLLEPCSYLQGYDYFSGSELTFIYVCVFLGFVPILCAGAGYCVVKLQNSRRRKFKNRQEALRNHNTKIEKITAREWLHANHKRLVTVKFGPETAIHTVDRKGEKLRTFSLKNVNTLLVEQSVETYHVKRPYLLLRIPNDHDLVLELESNSMRRKFIRKLEDFLTIHKKEWSVTEVNRDIMLQRAETRERRQKRLEHFFREAYALTFGLRPGERRRRSDASLDGEVITVMRTSLSKPEFAAALGMKYDDMFVRKMFNIVDKDKDGRISFQEFLETVVLFSRGKIDDKLRIIFDMCDNDRNGVIDKSELCEMMRSLVEIARTTTITDDQVTELIDQMFKDVGLEHKDHLTYQDFKLMMKEYKGEFVAIGLDCKGAKQNFLDTSTNIARMTSFHIEPSIESRRHVLLKKWDAYTTFLEENRQNIFYLFLFYVITIVLFVERFIRKLLKI